MKFTLSSPPAASLWLTPRLDVVLLLLVVLSLGLLVGQPLDQDADSLPAAPPTKPSASRLRDGVIHVGLRANARGDLAQLTLGGRSLGGGDAALERLEAELLALLGRAAGPLPHAVAVEIDADDALHYQHISRVVAACSGRIDAETNQLVRYADKIRFLAPR